MRKVVFFIDGWFMKKTVYKHKAFLYNGQNIREYCCKHLKRGDYLYRIFYYDTEPLSKGGHHPLTGKHINFSQTPVAEEQRKLLESLKSTPHFALRLGETIWRNNEWIINDIKLQQLLSNKIAVTDLVESDFKPRIEQKMVDIKIGLDITYIAIKRIADLLIIITGDADIVPVLKFARREGMQVGLDALGHHINPQLKEHVDFIDTQIDKYKKIPRKKS